MRKYNFFIKRRLFSTLTKINSVKEYHDDIIKCIDKVRVINPLVHCITNRVTTEKVANSLLAFGSSPAMIDNPKEVEEFAKIASCTYFNLGLHTTQVENINLLEKLRKESMKDKFMLIIDPIAVGATTYRTNVIKDIILKCQPNVIKGNIAEIYYLDKGEFLGKGVDSNNNSTHNETDIINSARNVALKYNCAVVVTSKTDYIVSPCSRYVAKINCDLKILTKITGSGCSVGALCAAATSVYPQNPFIACISATLIYKLAAFKAYQKEKYPGSLSHKIIDDIYYYSHNPHFLNFQIVDIYKAA
ncbi:putative hydroxyethylthiazole kinase [Plasmodium gaboni]|uniref:hydroxyethylthiazole kinase n=1 Tax=Plasmodium gaboni TaxID=647221 RepID=A0A151LGT5_9APIC|nr:putative hydroxyethylthiazole kinase [Plasmodium gaboni]KYN98190.1 putative hydroxyethylthiazole kinase [Plasmodium gaboni]SOV16630.1 hydroxyethylthiazole kinase, putative [Plasmodium gaboni]SOV23938.1 hydroxyethylthiazole kinase, putative [Plasmodium sp. DRC-Itaito]